MASPSTDEILPRNHSVEIIVKEYLSSRLKDHGFNGWTQSNGANGHSNGSQNGGQPLSSESLEQIQSALKSLTNELLSVQGSSIKELTATMNGSLPPTSFLDYSSFEKVSKTLFSNEIRWAHILTLLVFASELANERTAAAEVTNGTSQEPVSTDGPLPDVVDGAPVSASNTAVDFISHISDWLIRYLSSSEITEWINAHDGWNGIVYYEKERISSNTESSNEGGDSSSPDKGKDGSDDDNALNGLRSAINLVANHVE